VLMTYDNKSICAAYSLKYFAMILRIILFFSILFFQVSIFSQNSFILNIESDCSYTSSRASISDDVLYVVANYKNMSSTYYGSVMMKVNSFGEVVDSLAFVNPLGSIYIHEIISLDNDNFAIIGSKEIDGASGFFRLFYSVINQQLDEVYRVYYNLDTGHLDYISSFIKNNGNIVVAGLVQGNPPEWNFLYYDKIIMEFTQDGELIFDSIYNQANFEMVYDIIPFPNSDNIVLYCYPNFTGESYLYQLNILDSNYNLIDYYYTPDKGTRRSLVATSDTSFFTSSFYVDPNLGGKYAALRKYNSSFDDVSFIYNGSLDTLSYPATYKSLSAIDNENLYSGYTFNVDEQNQFSSIGSYFVLYSTNVDMELNWCKYYGGDAYYMLSYIEADTDGGCVLTGTKYSNGSSGPYKKDLVIMKVDQNGLITSTSESQSIPIKNAIVLPNPGKEYLQLHTGEYPTVFRLFNISGQQVLEEQISNETSRINTVELKQGTYIWQVGKC